MASKQKIALEDDDLLIDGETGFAVNVPAEMQKPYQWWITFPDIYKRIKAIRKALNIDVTDDLDGKIAKEKKSAIVDLFGEEN